MGKFIKNKYSSLSSGFEEVPEFLENTWEIITAAISPTLAVILGALLFVYCYIWPKRSSSGKSEENKVEEKIKTGNIYPPLGQMEDPMQYNCITKEVSDQQLEKERREQLEMIVRANQAKRDTLKAQEEGQAVL